MPQTDPIEIMIRHDGWATAHMLDACEKLTEQQLDQPFEMGVGTIRASLTHNLAAMRGWGDLLAGRDQRDRLESQGPFSIAELRRLQPEIADDFAASVRGHPADEIVRGERGGRAYAFTRGQVLTHVYTHSMHHRAQLLNMLRQLGVEQLPPSAVVEWCRAVDPVE